jgi:tetratricopeptide (TPR) repeat protein
MSKAMPGRMVQAALTLAMALAPALHATQSKENAEAELTFNAGMQHLREGRTELALDAFKKAIGRDSKNPYFHKALGIAYGQLADKCPPNDARCRQPKYNEAVAAARKALELNPYYVDARSDLGIWLLGAGKREEGKRELLTAYEDPTNPTPEHSARNLGQAYLDDKRPDLAQTWFATAVQRNKHYPDAYMSLAEVLLSQHKTDDAVRLLETGVKENPDDPSLSLALGQAYHRAGRLSDARSRWEKVASKDPAGPAGRRALELLRTLQQR